MISFAFISDYPQQNGSVAMTYTFVYMLTQRGYALTRHGSVLRGPSPQTLIGTNTTHPWVRSTRASCPPKRQLHFHQDSLIGLLTPAFCVGPSVARRLEAKNRRPSRGVGAFRH